MRKRTVFCGLILGLLLVGAAYAPSALGDPPTVSGIDEPAAKSITLHGVVEFDETKVVRIAAKAKGRIDKLHIKFIGQKIKRGDALADLDSTDLGVAAQNLLDAKKSGNAELERSARHRLAIYGLGKDEADEILRSGKPVGGVTVRAPISGHIIKKYQVEGDFVDEGARLFDAADLATVWIETEIKNQADVPLLKAKLTARITAKAVPKREFRGEVLGLFQDANTRMLKVRFAVKNPSEELRPGMLATVVLDVPDGSKGDPSDNQGSPYRLALQGNTDSKLKELLNERLATLRDLVKATQAAYLTGKVSFDRLHQAQRALLHAELELCDLDKERITVLVKAVALAKDFEMNALERYKSGAATQSDVLLGTAARLEAEIALERAKSKMPAGPK